MHEAVPVHHRQRAGDANAQPHRPFDRGPGGERPLLASECRRQGLARVGARVLAQCRDHVLQARALDVLPLEGQHLGVVEHAVHVHDVVVANPRQRPRFVEEALFGLRRHRQRLRQHLDRDVALQNLVAGEIDGAHAAVAEFAHDLVAAQDRATRLAAAGDAAR